MTETQPSASVTPTVYTSEEVISHFEAILEDTSFSAQLHYLGIKRVPMSPRRRRARQELQAMLVGLWKLALDKSFPAQSEDFFNDFLEKRGFNFKVQHPLFDC